MTDAEQCDVAIIGAGIMGCTAARALARYHVDVRVLEKAHDVGEGATKANSGIIHAGFHPRGGSLKGTSCVAGNAAYEQIARELSVPFVRTGALLCVFHEGGLEKMREKHDRALANGAGDLRIVSGDEARELEPRLSPRVICAMEAPTTAVISPFELALATARNACANGVAFSFGFAVEAIERAGGNWLLTASDGRRVRARFVLNMAGENAEPLDALVHPADLIVRPRRGEFIVFDRDESDGRGPVRHVLYQVQETDEGGTLLAPTPEGNLIAGPTSHNVRSFTDSSTSEEGLEHVRRVARKLVPDLDLGRVITEFAGNRANIVNVEKEKKDFVVRVSAPGFVSALGIKNPGMTSAPALVDRALDQLSREGLKLEPRSDFDPRDQGPHHGAPFLARPAAEQRALLERDRSFGHVVCRCENVTEGDVRACLHDTLPPTTLDGVKRRLRCGMGRCQGSFCTPRIVSIMADELGVRPEDIEKGERGGRPVRKAVK